MNHPELTYYEPPVEPRHHVTYLDLDPLEYDGLMSTVNGSNHESYEQLIQRNVRLPSDACIVVVGSDGKLERHAQSKTEFELILPHPDHGEVRDRVMQTLLAHPRLVHLELGPKQRVEVKVVGDPMPASYAFGDDRRIYPDRLLNSTLIIGSAETHRAIRKKVLREMTDPFETGKRIRNKMKDQLSEYRKAMRTGMYRGSLNFDPLSGAQYYQESSPIQTGYKPAFIRAVQRKFDLMTVAALQRQKLDESDVLAHLPAHTLGKFDYFESRGHIGRMHCEITSLSYAWFLQQYHHIQEHYKTAKKPVRLPISKHLYAHHASVIRQFVEQQPLFSS